MSTAWHAIAGFLNSPRVGWAGIAAIPYGIGMLVYPLTRKPPAKEDQPCPK